MSKITLKSNFRSSVILLPICLVIVGVFPSVTSAQIIIPAPRNLLRDPVVRILGSGSASSDGAFDASLSTKLTIHFNLSDDLSAFLTGNKAVATIDLTNANTTAVLDSLTYERLFVPDLSSQGAQFGIEYLPFDYLPTLHPIKFWRWLVGAEKSSVRRLRDIVVRDTLRYLQLTEEEGTATRETIPYLRLDRGGFFLNVLYNPVMIERGVDKFTLELYKFEYGVLFVQSRQYGDDVLRFTFGAGVHNQGIVSRHNQNFKELYGWPGYLPSDQEPATDFWGLTAKAGFQINSFLIEGQYDVNYEVQNNEFDGYDGMRFLFRATMTGSIWEFGRM